MICPDDHQLAAFVAGRLPGPEVAQMHAHVDTCSRCATVMAELGRNQPNRPSSQPPSAPDGLLRYERRGELGRGGMGVVYLAEDKVLRRQVALKLIRPDAFGHASLRERFVREARALASINHPHVVSIFDAGLSPEGAFVVMEHIDGTTFARWLYTKPREWEVVRVMCEAGDALAAVHRGGLVHRDVKPGNILITGNMSAKLTDFGLVAAPQRDNTLLTRAGVAVGTPAYMAPEQLDGGQADPRSDQYAFCVTLLEGLAGDRITSPRAAVVLANEARRGRGLPAPVWETLERGLSLDPQRRFASMEQLLAALRPFSNERAWRRRKAARVAWTLVALTLCIAALGGGGYAVGRYTASPRPRTLPTPTASPIAGAMRGQWHKPSNTLSVSADGLHVDERKLNPSSGKRYLVNASLRVTQGRDEAPTTYRIVDASLSSSHSMWSDDEGCRGTIELRDDALIVTLNGAKACRMLSGAWSRQRPPDLNKLQPAASSPASSATER